MKKKKDKKNNQNSNNFLKYWRIILLLLVIVVYGQTINFDFVNLDDDKIIVDNHEKIASIKDIPSMFVTQYGFDQGTPYYRPVILISFIIDSQLSGIKPLAYHFTNLLLHYLTVYFLFQLLLLIKIEKNIAFIITSVFAVHPLLTNAVVWIVGRNDMIATLFGILSFYYFIKFIQDSSVKNFLIHSVFFITAILSKEVTLVLPFLFITFLFFEYRQNFNWKFLNRFIFVWLFSIIGFQIAKSHIVIELGNLTYGLPAIKKNIQVVPEIIFKFFVPVNISVLPTYSLATSIIGLVLFIAIVLFPFINSEIRKKEYYFGLIWFLIFVLPGLAIYYSDQSNKFDFLDSRVYLPIVGLLILLGEILKTFNIDLKNKKYLGIISGIVLVFSVLTFFQSKKYQNPMVFAESAIISNPERPFFYHKLADYYYKVGRYSEAIDNMKTAIKLDPKNFDYHKNLILAYNNLSQFDNAIDLIFSALKLKPNDLELIRGLMIIYYKKGDFQNSINYADKFISLGGKMDKTFYETLKKKLN